MQTNTIFRLNLKNTIDIKQSILFILMSLIGILLFMRDVSGVGMSRWLFISIATVALLFCDKSNIYCFLAFLVPMFVGISGTYITAIALVILLAKQRFVLRVHGIVFLCILCVLFIEFLSSIRGMFSVVEYMRFVGKFLIVSLFLIDLGNEYDAEKMIKHFITGYCVAMTVLLGEMLQEYSLEKFLSLNIRFGNIKNFINIESEGMILSYNQNELGYFCVLCSSLSFLLYQRTKQKIYLLTLTGGTFFGIMTQSRAFLLSYMFGVVLFFAFSSKSLKLFFKSLIAVFLGLLSLFISISYLLPEYVTAFVERFKADDVSGGRINIALYYFEEMLQHIDRCLIGVGLQNYQEKYNFWASSHNATQEVLITWGFIGLSAVVTLFIHALRLARKKNPNASNVQYIPFLQTLLVIQSGQGFLTTTPFLLVMITYAAILLPPLPKKEKYAFTFEKNK